MAIFFPDISNYQGGIKIQPGTSFVWAKASEGTSFHDPWYANFKSQCLADNVPFGAYHLLHAGNGPAQADFCYSIVGPDVPLFLDVEPVGTSYPTMSDVKAFTARYKARGGLVVAKYYPKWYWTNQGAPSLLGDGLKLIASGYQGYSDNAANWNAYGGVAPFQWQFSDSYEYAGLRVDFNAYKGTIDEYLVAVGLKAPTPPAPPTPTPTEDDMAYLISVTPDPTEAAGNTNSGIFIVDAGTVVHIDRASFNAYEAKFGKPLVVDTAQYDALVAAAPAPKAA